MRAPIKTLALAALPLLAVAALVIPPGTAVAQEFRGKLSAPSPQVLTPLVAAAAAGDTARASAAIESCRPLGQGLKARTHTDVLEPIVAATRAGNPALLRAATAHLVLADLRDLLTDAPRATSAIAAKDLLSMASADLKLASEILAPDAADDVERAKRLLQAALKAATNLIFQERDAASLSRQTDKVIEALDALDKRAP